MKQNKLSIWYDKEGDYLEVNMKKCKETYFHEIKKDYAEIIEIKTQKIVGYAFFNFMKRKNKAVQLTLPQEFS